MEEKRILAIDYGSKRIGIAITDPLNIFAYPLITLTNDNKFFDNLKKILLQYKVVKILIGSPLKENGEESVTSQSVNKFIEELKKNLQIEIELVDERYSSEIARQRIIESVVSKKKRRDKSLIDKNAAAVILEDYLKSMQ
ncbi:MAG: Holliday junction resolvase RuvX [Ignavibacteriales bacterium]|jgi:putative Holliday junction resolvase|nr:Holliday junction resolvase RuvX [Ignavibacteriales bacterium]